MCGVKENMLIGTLGYRENYPKPILFYNQSINKNKSLRITYTVGMMCEHLLSKEVLKQIQSLTKGIKVV